MTTTISSAARKSPGPTDRPAVSLPDRASLWLALLQAGVCGVLALWLAAHYPLSPLAAVAAVLVSAAAAARWWWATPLLLGLLPLIGFAPWSGWITFEELDILVLSVAFGSYAALALRLPPQDRAPAWRHNMAYSPLTRLLLLLYGVALLIGMVRGFEDAGGFVFGWFQGYHEAMNSVRLTKSFFLAALLLPLWVQAGATRPREAARALLMGMVLALAAMSGAALWERLANTALLDFSSDYRSTALFWEMHVGGAALDGALSLAVPFGVLALLRARSPRSFLLLMALAMLAVYASLTTFSRGVFLSVPLSVAVLVLLRGLQRRRAAKAVHIPDSTLGVAALMSVPPMAKLGGLLLMGAFGLAAAAMFDSSGYRGQLALLGAMFVMLAMPASLWLPPTGQRVMAVLAGALVAGVLTALCWAFATLLPKGEYVCYVLALAASLLLRWRDQPGQVRPFHALMVAAAWFWMLGCMVIVAGSWGGSAASDVALLCALGLGLLLPLVLLVPRLWPFKAEGIPGWRSRGLVFGGLLLVAAVVAGLAGGAYIKERVSTTQQDLQGRFTHWEHGLSMLRTPSDWLFGKGAGRFVSNHFFNGAARDHTGDYRMREGADGRKYLVLTGGQYPLSFGDFFRVSQRIAAPQGAVSLKLRVHADQDVNVYAEVCDKHLLYADNCIMRNLGVKKGPGWQDLSMDLGTAPHMGGSLLLPRFVMFSVAIESSGGMADIAALDLRDASGASLLANGDFSADMSRWFFSSDRHHMPWHMKNFILNQVFDFGLVGAGLLCLLLLLALWRTSFGSGREHPLAPALAGSLVGFLAVGLFDSLIDAPRIGFMFYVVLCVALGLRALPGAVAEGRR